MNNKILRIVDVPSCLSATYFAVFTRVATTITDTDELHQNVTPCYHRKQWCPIVWSFAEYLQLALLVSYQVGNQNFSHCISFFFISNNIIYYLENFLKCSFYFFPLLPLFFLELVSQKFHQKFRLILLVFSFFLCCFVLYFFIIIWFITTWIILRNHLSTLRPL